MSIVDLFETKEHRNNMAHFAVIVNLATIDGKINFKEEQVIKRFAEKLDISEEEYKEILKNPDKYNLTPPYSLKKRLERLFDLFQTVYADHYMNDQERKLVFRYALELGFSEEKGKKIVENSIRIFTGRISFEEYQKLLNG